MLLRAFAATAKLKSVTAAAAELNLSQGTISQQLRRLEDRLGRRLFERDHRGTRLTAFGDRALEHANRLLIAHDLAWQELTDSAPPPVRLGLPPDLVRRWMPALLQALAECAPQVHVDLRVDMSETLATARSEVDLAIIEERSPSAGFVLSTAALVWVGAPNGSAAKRRPLPVSLVGRDCAFRPMVIDALNAAAVPARYVYEAGDIEATTALVRADHAVTVWLRGTVPSDLQVIELAGLPTLPRLDLCLHRGARRDPPSELVAGTLRKLLA